MIDEAFKLKQPIKTVPVKQCFTHVPISRHRANKEWLGVSTQSGSDGIQTKEI
jgi:hypothetical protein